MEVMNTFKNAFTEVPWFLPLVALCCIFPIKRK